MANQKITDLVNLRSDEVAHDDLTLIVDRSSLSTPTGESKNITTAEFAAYVTSSTDINALVGYPLSASNGGTGIAGPAVDVVLVGNGNDALKQITGTNGYWLRKNPSTGTPEFADAATNININQMSGSPLLVNNGGTGRSSLTLNTVLVGNGNSNVSLVGPGLNNQVLAGVTGGAPTFQNISTLVDAFSGQRETLTNVGGFSPGQVVRKTSGGYTLANAGTIGNSYALGLVESTSSTDFTVVYHGKISFGSSNVDGFGVNGLIDGTTYWLSPSVSGRMTTSRPTATDTVYNGIMIATGVNTGVVVNWGPVLNTSGSSGGGGGTTGVDSGYKTTFMLMGA